MKILQKAKAEITVRRPNGQIETAAHPKFETLNDVLFAKIVKATREAGRGECIGYRNIDAVVEMEESDYMSRCERCGKKVDTRKAYRQKEWARFGGSKIRVDSFYCEGCHRLLSSIGAGETTDLEHRAGHVPSVEPYTKSDF